MRKLLLLAAGSAVAVVGVLGIAGTANAAQAQGHSVITKSTTSYTSPSNQSTPMRTDLTAGTQVETLCFTEGQELNGNHYWFRIVKDGEHGGYVHRDAISGASGLKHC